MEKKEESKGEKQTSKSIDEFAKLRNLAVELKNLQLQILKDLSKSASAK